MSARVFAVAAHADDIEFGMAGTLILLAQAGCEIHYLNLANGSCGSATHSAEAIAAIRLNEARQAALDAGADAFVFKGDPVERLVEVLQQVRGTFGEPLDR